MRYKDTAPLNYPRRSELTCLVDSLRNFFKNFDHAGKCIQITLLKPKIEFGSIKSKENLFAHYYNDITDNQSRRIRLSFRLGNNNSAYFPSKSLKYPAINSFLQKLSTLTSAKFTISTRTDITWQTSVKRLRAIKMSSAFTPDCGHYNSTIILNGDVYCPNTKRLGKLCQHRKTFQSLGRSDY